MTPRAVTLAAKDRIAITLPWWVAVPDNAKYGVMGGRMILTKRYRDAKKTASYYALTETRNVAGRLSFPSGPVLVMMRVFPPDRRRRDLTNVLKLLCDAMVGSAYADDSQIAKLTIERGAVSPDNPRVEITVEAK